jgi:hypothetical protein
MDAAGRYGRSVLPPWPRLDRPAFVIGCGRSGTTILGTVLSRHPDVTYLNEPRDLWIRSLPAADVWSADAARRGGRLTLGAADATPAVRWRLRRAFARAVRRTGRPRLVEKLPINTFRLAFIAAAIPGARFVHLVRDGRAVASSIARWCEAETWYGVDDYKWRLLRDEAARRPETADLPARCRTSLERGLLEWRLAEEATERFFASRPDVPHLAVRYEHFVDDPSAVLRRMEAFLELRHDPALHAWASTEVRERHAPPAALDATGDAIAGALLARLGYLPASAAAAGAGS